MGITLSYSYSLLILIFIFTTTQVLYFTSASSATSNPKNNSKADDESSGIEHVWCVAKNNADDAALQAAIDWACSSGGVDCSPIQTNGPCYDPNNIQSTASYVFNDYYLAHGRTDDSCDFSGSAAVSSLDPSHDKCKFSFGTLAVATGGFIAVGTSVPNSGSEIIGPSSVAIILFSFAFLAI